MGSLGVTCVLVTAGVLAWEAATATGDRPQLEARVVEVVEEDGAWYVEVEVHNHGDVAAAEVVVEAVAGREHHEATLEHVPSRSSRQATLLFERAPAADELTARAISFVDP